MGWLGDVNQMVYALGIMGADTDDDGKIILSGNVSLFMGIGPDVAVDDKAVYYVDGKPLSISGAMGTTSYGSKVIVL